VGFQQAKLSQSGISVSLFRSVEIAISFFNLLIEKGLVTEAEFMEKIKAETVTYQAMIQKVR